MGEKKGGKKCFQMVSNKRKECYRQFSPTKFASAQFNPGTTAQVRNVLKCNEVTIFLETWNHPGTTSRILLKGSDPKPAEVNALH